MANKSATIAVRIEPEVKREVEKIFNAIGLSTAEAVNIFFRRVQLERGIPFDVGIPEIPNKETRKAIEDSRRGRNLRKTKNAAELFKELGI
ncbi:MAG: type II toxin-antitoxin system RelB/DinJ family antitoxin [Bacteroidetes bacterium]|nr:type II toxin-antitoxin system RelB/DinJ family antitoxin [Bacteroidota bacterium]